MQESEQWVIVMAEGHFMVYFTQKGSMYLKGELLPHLGALTLTSLLQELN